MLFHVKAYLKFLWHSKNEHGVHSPFVFSLITKSFYDKKTKADYTLLRKYRSSLLKNNKTIHVTDFGAGSRIFKSNVRAVSKIAQTAGITKKRAELLYRIVHYFEPNNILEIGTSLGLATSALSLGNRMSSIVTLEGCPETATIAQQQFKEFGLDNVNSVVTEFGNYLRTVSDSFQMIYFDGNHSKQATLDYFELLLPTVTNDSVWIFDDIHWSAEMEEAWDIIKQNPKVTVTIDTFQWGLIFFRREQEKENFVIRVH